MSDAEDHDIMKRMLVVEAMTLVELLFQRHGIISMLTEGHKKELLCPSMRPDPPPIAPRQEVRYGTMSQRQVRSGAEESRTSILGNHTEIQRLLISSYILRMLLVCQYVSIPLQPSNSGSGQRVS